MTHARSLLRAAPWLLATVLCACSTAPKQQASKSPIRTVVVIPATEPDWYSLHNRNALAIVVSPLIGAATAYDSRQKAQVFTDKMRAQRPGLAEQLTASVVESLGRQGVAVRALGPGDTEGNDLVDVDYENFKSSADAVLHLTIMDVGVYSGYGSVDYLPKLNVRGYMFRPHGGAYVADESVYYGVDGREGKAWSVAADPALAYRTFEDLVEKAPALAVGLRRGTGLAAERLAENIQKALR
jgi:hypothetical protein